MLWSFQRDGRRVKQGIAIHRVFVELVVKGKKLVVFLLGNGIKLVIMTLAAADGQPHPDGSQRIDAIDGISNGKFLWNGTSFSGADVATIEAGCHQLIDARVG